MERLWKLSSFITSNSWQEVRSQELSSQAVSPSLHPRAAYGSGVPVTQAWAQLRDKMSACIYPEARVFILPFPLVLPPHAVLETQNHSGKDFKDHQVQP